MADGAHATLTGRLGATPRERPTRKGAPSLSAWLCVPIPHWNCAARAGSFRWWVGVKAFDEAAVDAEVVRQQAEAERKRQAAQAEGEPAGEVARRKGIEEGRRIVAGDETLGKSAGVGLTPAARKGRAMREAAAQASAQAMAQARAGEAQAKKAQAKAEAVAQEEREWADKRVEKAEERGRREVWGRMGAFSRTTIMALRRARLWHFVAPIPLRSDRSLGAVLASLARYGAPEGWTEPPGLQAAQAPAQVNQQQGQGVAR